MKSEIFKIIPETGAVKVTVKSSFLSLRAYTESIRKNRNKYLALVLGYRARKGILEKLNKSTGV
ncbi:MAG: hypothetical protein QW303_04220, partial [Nitrososphaerota archaeon]